MKIVPLGEAAFILRELPAPSWCVAAHLEDLGLPGLIEVAPAWDTVGLFVDPEVFDLATLPTEWPAWDDSGGRHHRVPVLYRPETVALALEIPPQRVIQLHSEPEYRVVAVGFQPGFPYLRGLLPPLDQLPRKTTPDLRKAAGTVAIAAGQCGIYPAESPGGWHDVGITPLDIRTGFPILAGDWVRFEPINEAAFAAMKGQTLA